MGRRPRVYLPLAGGKRWQNRRGKWRSAQVPLSTDLADADPLAHAQRGSGLARTVQVA